MHLPFKTERTEAARGKQRQSQCCHSNSTPNTLVLDGSHALRHREWCRSATPRFSSCSMLYAAFRSVFDVYFRSKIVR